MRVTRSRGGGLRATPRAGARNRPPTPRGPAATARFRTPSPNRTRRSASRDSANSSPSESIQANENAQNSQQVQQPVVIDNTNQPEASAPPIQPTLSQDEQQQGVNQPAQETSEQTRPPTPNWTGFAPQPDFQQARENDRAAFEAGEEIEHPSYSRIWNRMQVVPMEPLSIDNDFYLDYRDSQNVKFFNKGKEKLPGEPFSGKNIFSWLRRLEMKANEFHWIPTLTIDGKLLTTHFAELSMEKVREAAQKFQDEAQRKAQNSRMLLYCITSSITAMVMDKLALKSHLFTL